MSKILLVDDEPDLVRALSVRLRASGFECETATNGREGLAKVAQWHPDLIISDLLMPEMDGYELYRQLHTDARTATIPVMILSAAPQRELDHRLAGLDVACVMRKPFDSLDLLKAIRDVLAMTSQGDAPHG